MYATHDSIASIVRRKKDALILDFFAGSGTTLNAINLLNYEDGGSRRCILITNNEVSDSDAKELIKYGNVPGTQIWENHGICRSVTWPRTKYSILGVHSDGTPLQKDYITTRTIEDEAERSIKQIRFNPEQIVDIKIRKDIVSLLGKDKLPQSLVKPGIDFVVSEKYNATILFSPSAYEEWIAALDGQDHVTELYVVTTSNKEFKKIKEQLIEAMGAIAVSKIEKISMAVGFKANAAYFKLGFLDKASVRIGRQFREMLPILWMKAGCFGPCPSLIDQKIPEYMIFPENRIAILNDNSCFAEFAEEVRNTSKIETVYLVTDSDADYRSMSKELNVKQTYQLYRDYLDNFRINSRR